jgi:regulatory protein
MTDIVQEVVKRVGFKLIRLQSGDSIKVPASLFRLYPLRAKDEINVAAYQLQLGAQESRHAMEQAVRMLEMRDRSTKEIEDKLLSVGYSQQTSQYVCQKLTLAGYLDDRRYARAVLDRLGKKLGTIRLRRELQMKGISPDLTAELLEERDPDMQLESAVRLAKKALRSKASEPNVLYRRVYGMLARRGYTPDLVRKALEIVLHQEPDGQSDA